MTGTLAAVLIVYVFVVTGIAVWSAFQTKTEEDFIVAGRSIGPFVGGAVLAATQISAGTVVGTLGRHYFTGVSWWYIWFGVWAGWLTSAFFVAPKLRRFGALTVPDYIATRFGSEKVGALAAILIIVSYSIYLVAQFQASGEIARAVLGIRPLTAMLVIVASTSVYTMLGGVRSSSYIELLQTLLIVFGLLIAVPVLLNHAGGFGQAMRFLDSMDPRLLRWYYGPKELIAFGVAFSLSIAAAPYEMTRYYSMRDEKTVKQAIAIAIGFQFIIGLSVLAIGLLTRVLFPNLASPDQASSIMAFEVLPPLVGALLIVGMVSAIMSTVNSILLVTGASVAHDLYGKFIRPDASQARLVGVNRIAIVVLAVVPVFFALREFGDVQTIVIEQAKFIASFFFVPVVIGLNWRGGTAAGATAGMVGGFFACLVWEFTGQRGFATHGIDAVEVGVVTSLILFLAVSRYTRPVAEENVRIFFGTN
ncbi:MAG: sodium/solute symporter [Gemmatimonadetes bacterium]|nr:sodium/solute symporter [Gemmatimonadota bacterium]